MRALLTPAAVGATLGLAALPCLWQAALSFHEAATSPSEFGAGMSLQAAQLWSFFALIFSAAPAAAAYSLDSSRPWLKRLLVMPPVLSGLGLVASIAWGFM